MEAVKEKILSMIADGDSLYEITTKLDCSPFFVRKIAEEAGLKNDLDKNSLKFLNLLKFKTAKGENVNAVCSLYNIQFKKNRIEFIPVKKNNRTSFERLHKEITLEPADTNEIAITVNTIKEERKKLRQKSKKKDQKKYHPKKLIRINQKYNAFQKEEALQLIGEINDVNAASRMLNITESQLEAWMQAERPHIGKPKIDSAKIVALYKQGFKIMDIKRKTCLPMGAVKSVLRKEIGYKTFYQQHGLIKSGITEVQADFDIERRKNIVGLYKEGWGLKELSDEFGLTSHVIEKILYKEGSVNEITIGSIRHRKPVTKRNQSIEAEYARGLSISDLALKYDLLEASIKSILKKLQKEKI